MGCHHWIDLANDRMQWWALVNMVMNLKFSCNGKFLSGFSRRVSSMQLCKSMLVCSFILNKTV
jgi:hypothetical protein